MYSVYKLNKQGDNIQLWHTPFLIWNQSIVPCLVLTAASWPANRFLRRQVSWSGIPISLRIFQFVVIHMVKGFGVVNEAEVDVFLEFSCFFHNPTDVGNLISGSIGNSISGSSAFSKSDLNIWKFLVVCLRAVKGYPWFFDQRKHCHGIHSLFLKIDFYFLDWCLVWERNWAVVQRLPSLSATHIFCITNILH